MLQFIEVEGSPGGRPRFEEDRQRNVLPPLLRNCQTLDEIIPISIPPHVDAERVHGPLDTENQLSFIFRPCLSWKLLSCELGAHFPLSPVISATICFNLLQLAVVNAQRGPRRIATQY